MTADTSPRRDPAPADPSADLSVADPWRARLSGLAFRVTRLGGTERPFTHDRFPEGPATFHCICCDAPLFRSEDRYESGCGWPSFTAPVTAEALRFEPDRSWCMCRTEVRCARCAAHLGHVFDDGPAPARLRFCINGVALAHRPRG